MTVRVKGRKLTEGDFLFFGIVMLMLLGIVLRILFVGGEKEGICIELTARLFVVVGFGLIAYLLRWTESLNYFLTLPLIIVVVVDVVFFFVTGDFLLTRVIFLFLLRGDRASVGPSDGPYELHSWGG
jgi:hypothetical protein